MKIASKRLKSVAARTPPRLALLDVLSSFLTSFLATVSLFFFVVCVCVFAFLSKDLKKSALLFSGVPCFAPKKARFGGKLQLV